MLQTTEAKLPACPPQQVASASYKISEAEESSSTACFKDIVKGKEYEPKAVPTDVTPISALT